MPDSFVTTWTVADQAHLSMGILQARILEWLAVPFSRGSSRPGIKPACPALAGRFFTTKPPGKPLDLYYLAPDCGPGLGDLFLSAYIIIISVMLVMPACSFVWLHLPVHSFILNFVYHYLINIFVK